MENFEGAYPEARDLPVTLHRRSESTTGRAAVVVPPFASRKYPSLEGSLVHSAILNAGWKADIFYENHSFCSYIGHDLYDDMSSIQRSIGVGDWVCSALLNDNADKLDPNVLEHSKFSTFTDYLVEEHGYSLGHIALFQLVSSKFSEFANSFAQTFEQNTYDIVFFCCKHQQLSASLVMADLLKPKTSKCGAKVFLFGEMLNGLAEASCIINNCPGVDGILVNSPARIIEDGINDLLSNKTIPGVLRTGGDQNSYLSPASRDGAIALAPHFEDYYRQYTMDSLQSVLPFQSSQGCWWKDKSHCTFCGLIEEGQQYVSKSGDQVLEELLDSVQKTQALDVVTADLLLDYKYFDSFLPKLADLDYDITLFFEIKAGMSKEQLTMLRDSGVLHVQIGIESFDQKTLKHMKKGTTALKNIRTLKWCKELGIEVSWIYLYGFPEDTRQSLNDQAALVESLVHLAPPIAVTNVRIEKNSPMHASPEDFGMRIRCASEPYLHTYPFTIDELDCLAKEYEHDYIDGRDPESDAAVLKSVCEKWAGMNASATLRYYRGPGFIKVADYRYEGFVMTLSGWRAEMFEILDDIASISSIREKLLQNDHDVDKATIRSTLRELQQYKLVVNYRNSWLSIVPRVDKRRIKQLAGAVDS